jgi:hypothetical protein
METGISEMAREGAPGILDLAVEKPRLEEPAAATGVVPAEQLAAFQQAVITDNGRHQANVSAESPADLAPANAGGDLAAAVPACVPAPLPAAPVHGSMPAPGPVSAPPPLAPPPAASFGKGRGGRGSGITLKLLVDEGILGPGKDVLSVVRCSLCAA